MRGGNGDGYRKRKRMGSVSPSSGVALLCLVVAVVAAGSG